MKKLSTGVQDFEKIRKNNMIYVDKTRQILDLIRDGLYIFFARPRRFGKSLLCSTLSYLYQGRKDLFEGLYIYDQIDWEDIVHPVIYIDFSQIAFQEVNIQEAVMACMKKIAEDAGIELYPGSPSLTLQNCLNYFAAQGKRTVIIIDEYDKALTDVLGNEQKFNEHRDFLRGFYGMLKPNDKNIHQVFITGVSKYGKLSVFSQLNNITDYSMHENYTTICGYTPEELEFYFEDYLEETAKKFERSKTELLDRLKFRYNGYSFDGIYQVYNPYSMLNFFTLKEFKNYWFDTGTPYFLLNMLKEQNIKIHQLENTISNPSILDIADIEHQSAISLLFQTGYLTIKETIRKGFNTRYRLDFPNTEVKQAFAQYLLITYTNMGLDRVYTNISYALADALERLDFDKFCEVLQGVYAQIPYQIYIQQEAYYHTIFHVVMNSLGFKTQSEVQTNIGRIDSVIETDENVFIFEFKLDEAQERALEQIESNKYFQIYQNQELPIYAVGINFSSEQKNVESWLVRKLKA
ncbi:MAG: AAA family ATPase [Microscillaceae bacterium]|nr:AAA family ATPase [Microscillaceae bacterium]